MPSTKCGHCARIKIDHEEESERNFVKKGAKTKEVIRAINASAMQLRMLSAWYATVKWEVDDGTN